MLATKTTASTAPERQEGDSFASESAPISSHVVFVTWPAVGHVTPMMDCATAFLAAQPTAFVSFLTSPDMVDYLGRSSKCSAQLQQRFRVIPVGTEALGDNPLTNDCSLIDADSNPMKGPSTAKSHDKNQTVMKTLRAATQIALHFRQIFPVLLADEHSAALNLARVGTSVTAVVCNWLTFGIDAIVKATAPNVKLVSFFDHSSFFSTRLLGPRKFGGYGDTGALWAQHCKKTDHPSDDKAELERLFGRRFGNVEYHIPGTNIEPITDEGCSPQAPDYLVQMPITPSLLNIQGLVDHSDAMLINTYDCLEGNIMSFLQQYTATPIIPIGPVMLQNLARGGCVGTPRQTPSPVTDFLDRQPENSVLYVSFGTLFRPNPEQLVIMIDLLLDDLDNVPFLWTLGGQESLTAELHGVDPERVSALNSKLDRAIHAGKAYICNWVDQNAVLCHPSVSFFLTHGGWNSATEAILAGKPMITFPFFGDQLFTAKLLKSHGVAKVIHSKRDQPADAFRRSVLANLQVCADEDQARTMTFKAANLRMQALQERGDAAQRRVWSRVADILGP